MNKVILMGRLTRDVEMRIYFALFPEGQYDCRCRKYPVEKLGRSGR